MKRIKEFLDFIKGLILLFLVFGWWIWIPAIILFIYYLISISDLPDWFKFFLLH